ncbi:DNA-directed DNA polymerase [Tanacetum coccineum]
MIYMPKGAKVLKDLLSHKEKLEKAASLVKLSEECFAIIQRSLTQKEGDPGSFTLPWISKLKPTKMSIQLADRSIKYPIGVCENLLVKISKFIFLVDFVVLEMDKDRLVSIILGRPFLVTARAVIDVHEGKFSLKVGSETVTFNIEKSMKSKHSHDDYLYCADHTAKLVQEQWVDIVNHDGKWTKEEEEDYNEVLAVFFYLRTKPVEPLEWKATENRLKPSSVQPPKLELKELPEHLERLPLRKQPTSSGHLIRIIHRRKSQDPRACVLKPLSRSIKSRRTLIHNKEMDLVSAQNNTIAKLPLLKQGDYEMWRLRIDQYIQLQDYALWEIIENGNSFIPVA